MALVRVAETLNDRGQEMETRSTNDCLTARISEYVPYTETLINIMKRRGARCRLNDFHNLINIVFHRYESAVYDRIHHHMWKSLARQFDLLSTDTLSIIGNGSKLSLLDVGCGTGLGAALLLQTRLGNHIASVDLLDTSSEMLNRARARLRLQANAAHCGSISAIRNTYDVVLTCSVLHHITDLKAFLKEIDTKLSKGGVFLHLQDPNGDYLTDPELNERQHRLLESRDYSIGLTARVVDKLLTLLGRRNYIDKINAELLASGIIDSPMTDDELWKFTDIHYENGLGISIREISKAVRLRKVSVRSYAFFGKLRSELPTSFRKEEDILTNRGALNGWAVSGVWLKE